MIDTLKEAMQQQRQADRQAVRKHTTRHTSVLIPVGSQSLALGQRGGGEVMKRLRSGAERSLAPARPPANIAATAATKQPWLGAPPTSSTRRPRLGGWLVDDMEALTFE